MVRPDDYPAGISRCFRTRRGEGAGRFRFSVVAFGHRVLNPTRDAALFEKNLASQCGLHHQYVRI
jgi:hypothetical protein